MDITADQNFNTDSPAQPAAKDTGFFGHSIVRGASTAVGYGSALHVADQLGEMALNDWGMASLYCAGVGVGILNYLMHKPKEEIGKLQREVEPEKWGRNLFNSTMEYSVSGIMFGMAAIGTAAATLSNMTVGAINDMGLSFVNIDTIEAGATAGAGAALLGAFALTKDFFTDNSTKKNALLKKKNAQTIGMKYQ